MGKGGVSEELRKCSHTLDNIIIVFSSNSSSFNRLLNIGCGDGQISMNLKSQSNAKEAFCHENKDREQEENRKRIT